MEASLAATGMLEVLATRAVLFMILSTTPPISTFNCSEQIRLLAVKEPNNDHASPITSRTTTTTTTILPQVYTHTVTHIDTHMYTFTHIGTHMYT